MIPKPTALEFYENYEAFLLDEVRLLVKSQGFNSRLKKTFFHNEEMDLAISEVMWETDRLLEEIRNNIERVREIQKSLRIPRE